eukprot:scaffold5298_cov67-Phaeocystis_antarctica.AAC.11
MRYECARRSLTIPSGATRLDGVSINGVSMKTCVRFRLTTDSRIYARHASHSSSVKPAPEAAFARSLPKRAISHARTLRVSPVTGCGSVTSSACRKSPALRRTGGSGGKLLAARAVFALGW